jgi:hypothetical protein
MIRRRRAKELIIIKTVLTSMRTCYKIMIRKKDNRIHTLIGKMIARKLQLCYKRFSGRKGTILESRVLNIARYTLSMSAYATAPLKDDVARKVMYQFFIAHKIRVMLKAKCMHY